MGMAHIVVMYDIVDDGLRNRVADACLDYGLERAQFSVFVGELGRVHQRELELRLRELVGRRAAKIRLMALDEQTWARQRVIEQGGE
jgi:CRISPR-associated protein Cas2